MPGQTPFSGFRGKWNSQEHVEHGGSGTTSMTERIGYREAAPLYWAAGWRGVLRIPWKQKDIPPKFYTGYTGEDPTWDEVEYWRRKLRGNLILRVPEIVKVVDVDAYLKNGKQKIGGVSLRALVAKWGPLPATWRSTSRPDGISGKRFYRVEPGLILHDPGAQHGLDLAPGEKSDIEIVQHHHRFALVWPSFNPSSQAIERWYDPDGSLSDRVPRVDELPYLPPASVEGLSHGPASSTKKSPTKRSGATTTRTAPDPDDPMVRLLTYLGITEDLDDRGDEIGARCKKHEERTGHREQNPRHWSVNRITGKHGCWSCGWSGSLHRLVMDVKGVGPWEATQIIRTFGVELQQDDQLAPQPDAEPLNEDDLQALLDSYDDPPQRALNSRRITAEAAQDYGIRWSDNDNAWVFPVRDPVGRLVGLHYKCGKTLWCKKGTPLGSCLFGFDVLDSTQPILLESPLDVAYLHTLGHRFSVVSSFGSYASDAQMDLLVNSDALKVVLASDNDEAGWKGVRSTLDRGWHRKIPIHLFEYSDDAIGKDPGDLSPEEIECGLAKAKRVPARRKRR